MNEFDQDTTGMSAEPEELSAEWIKQRYAQEITPPPAPEADPPAPEETKPQPSYRTRGWIALLVMATVCALLMGVIIGLKAPTPAEPTEYITNACHSVVLIEVKSEKSKGHGSGVILTADGYIATNHHVVHGATEILVHFTTGKSAAAKIISSSEEDDLALLKVERYGLHAATFATEESYVGQSVYAIGHPGSALLAWTTTHGIISYVDRELPVRDEEGKVQGKRVLLQTDATVNPGNSGGALVNEKGEVVGIITSRVETMQDAGLESKDEITYRGLGFSLPAKEAWDILSAMIRDGDADGVTSGIYFARPAVEMAYGYVEKGEKYKVVSGVLKQGRGTAMPHSGIYVIDPMDTALKEGDIITHINGHVLDEENLYESALLAFRPGDVVTFTVYREGETVEVKAILKTTA